MNNELFKTWIQIKTLKSVKSLQLQYHEDDKKYIIYMLDGIFILYTELWKDISTVEGIDENQNNLDLIDFENNYKSLCNKPLRPQTEDGKEIVRSESRPLGYTTYFTGRGDSANHIGDGKEFKWDFSNSDDIVTPPPDSKRKHLEATFIDEVYIKDGKFYIFDSKKGTYVDLYAICPAGMYYRKNDGTPVLATVDTIVARYVIHHFIQGTAPMGDSLEAEACSQAIPAGYRLCLDVTVPSNDSGSNGHAEMEIFRKRTVILE